MKLEAFLDILKTNNISFRTDAPMDCYTTFKIGGTADVLVFPDGVEQLSIILKFAKEFEVPSFIIGKGSNLLVSDNGIEGAVVSLSALDNITVNGDKIVCGAGASLASVCITAKENSLSGLEFAYGIPGSVGGALFMNAGAYGGEMSQVVVGANCIDNNGQISYVPFADMQLGYRTSIFKLSGLIILDVEIQLKDGTKEQIANAMNDFLRRRKEKQPLEFPSAGSTFRRPQGYYAGALIEKNGLKGFSVGDAQVSEKHAGFVINRGNATSKDVCALIQKIKETVYNGDGVMLEPEVIFVGR